MSYQELQRIEALARMSDNSIVLENFAPEPPLSRLQWAVFLGAIGACIAFPIIVLTL